MRQLIIIFIFCLPQFLSAQIIFEPAYYIDLNDNRIEGLIKNMDWRSNPSQFDFKSSEEAEVQVLTIIEVKAFGFESGIRFTRFNVNIDQSKNEIDQLDTERNPKFKAETVFLKQLVKGSISLWVYTKEYETRFFSQENNDIPLQLVYKRYRPNIRELRTNEYYKSQLQGLLSCESLRKSDFQNLNYTLKSLKKIFIAYNSCVDPKFELTEVAQSSPSFFKLNLNAGISVINYKYNGFPTSFGRVDADFGTFVGSQIGLGLEYVLPFNKNKWSILFEPSLIFAQVEQTQFDLDIRVNLNTIRLPFGVQHTFFLAKENQAIILNGMIGIDLFPGDIQFATTGQLDIRSKSRVSLGGGFRFNKRMSLETRYTFNSTPFGDFLSNNSRQLFNDFGSDLSNLAIIFNYTILRS